MITTEKIKNLKPCANRLKNYLNYYENKTFTYQEFISLDEISFEDKVWVLLRLMNLKDLVSLSQDTTQNAVQCVQNADQDAYQDAALYAQTVAHYAARCASQVVGRDFVLNLILKFLK